MKRSVFVVASLCLVGLLWFVNRADEPTKEVSAVSSQAGEELSQPVLVELSGREEDADARGPIVAEPEQPTTEGTPMCFIQGRLVTPEGEPLAGLSLEFRRMGAEIEWICESDSAGRFEQEIPWQAGARDFLQVHPSEHTQRYRDMLPSMDPGVVDLGDLVCFVGTSIRGRVTDVVGNGIPEAKIMSLAGNRYAQARTDEEGNYVILGVLPGSNQVSASCPMYMHEGPRESNVRIGEPAGDVDFVLQASPTLDGIVVDGEGVGVAGASVEVSPEVGPSNRGSSQVVTDAGGFFRAYPTLPGEQSVSVLHPDYLPYGSRSEAT
ncbi:MAG: carboxypeptidase regulatory-like domain-containing protein [bacterium]|nr:carboxypeptidase regulatory-like domain-containing protein [bacterium]